MLPVGPGGYPPQMPREVLIVSDSKGVREEVKASLPASDMVVRELTRGAQVRDAVQEKAPDLAVIDLQIGRMGGMATCLDLRLEAGAGRLPHVPVLMLLDRRADVFLARRSGAEGWVVKPIDAMRLSRAIETVLDGGRYEDDAYRPPTVALR
jgi:DNA-binding NarL/FixJ family response regulator